MAYEEVAILFCFARLLCLPISSLFFDSLYTSFLPLSTRLTIFVTLMSASTCVFVRVCVFWQICINNVLYAKEQATWIFLVFANELLPGGENSLFRLGWNQFPMRQNSLL